MNKAIRIFQLYDYKLQIFKKLTAKLKNKYDLRYCQPYMDSACMRSVVYFSLYEIGKQHDYRLLKKKITNREISANQRIFNVKTENGRLIFTSNKFIEDVDDI